MNLLCKTRIIVYGQQSNNTERVMQYTWTKLIVEIRFFGQSIEMGILDVFNDGFQNALEINFKGELK